MSFYAKLLNYFYLLLEFGLKLENKDFLIIQLSKEQKYIVPALEYACKTMGVIPKIVLIDKEYEKSLTTLKEMLEYVKTLPNIGCAVRLKHKFLFFNQENQFDFNKKLEEIKNLNFSIGSSFFFDYIERNNIPRVYGLIPTSDWTQKLFEDQSKIMEVWELLFKSSYADEEKALEILRNKKEEFYNLAKKLNNLDLKSIKIETNSGTNISIGINNYNLWNNCLLNDKYMLNFPSYEIFGTPDFRKVEGILKITKPSNIYGETMESGSIEFKSGNITNLSLNNKKITKWIEDKQNNLKELGEIGIVDKNIPIKDIDYYQTILDENKTTHLALGNICKEALKIDEEILKYETKQKNGITSSKYHFDFCIGDNSTHITGLTKDKKRVLIMKDNEYKI